MRKLEYLRSVVRKCSTLDEIVRTKLPDEFRLHDDIGDCPRLKVVTLEKDGKTWLNISVIHSRIEEHRFQLTGSIFVYTDEEPLYEGYMIPASNKYKLGSPIKSKSGTTKDYSNWDMAKEGTPCMHPTDDKFLDYIPMPMVTPHPDHFIVEHYIMHHDGKLPSSLAEACRDIYSHI